MNFSWLWLRDEEIQKQLTRITICFNLAIAGVTFSLLFGLPPGKTLLLSTTSMHVVLFIMLHKVVLTFSSGEET